MPKYGKKNFQIRNLDPALWLRFKVMATKRGRVINTLIHELLKKEVERFEREEGEK